MTDRPTIELCDLIQRIHGAAAQFALAITGGGSRAIADLLERPGGSRVLLEAVVPYSSAALVNFLQATPEQYCSARTARLMAMAAYQRALRLASAGPQSDDDVTGQKVRSAIGLGCTASLTSELPKRGAHRIHVAYQTRDATAEYSLVLVKGRRTRIEEELVAAGLVLNTLSQACGNLGQVELCIHADEPIGERRAEADEAQQDLLHGRRRQVQVGRVPILTAGQRRAIFPGAYNPLHDGHRQMARIAREKLELPVEFEISIHNVDKPPLDYLEMRERGGQFGEDETLWLTRAPTFEEKSRLFPDATFVVGADTIARIADPAYYSGSGQAMLSAIDRITERGGRFLVFGRKTDSAGGFEALESLELPPALLAICAAVPESEFRADVSSTELRLEQNSMSSFVPRK